MLSPVRSHDDGVRAGRGICAPLSDCGSQHTRSTNHSQKALGCDAVEREAGRMVNGLVLERRSSSDTYGADADSIAEHVRPTMPDVLS